MVSKEAFDLCVNNDLINLAGTFIGDSPLLKCVRSYQIRKSNFLFNWHPDNKSSIDASPDDSIGLVGIIFLEDDRENSFCLVTNTRNQPKNPTANALQEQIIEFNKPEKHVKINAECGDLLLFSQDMYHRHIIFKQQKLDAMWFQIIGASKGTPESICVQSSYLPSGSLALPILDYLGAGSCTIGYRNPVTSLNSLSYNYTLKILVFITSNLFIRLVKKLSRSLRLIRF